MLKAHIFSVPIFKIAHKQLQKKMSVMSLLQMRNTETRVGREGKGMESNVEGYLVS